MNWKTLDAAPVWDYQMGSPPTCLVYGPDIGVKTGRAWKYPDGEAVAQADGFHGQWLITHWMPLPEKPE